MAQEVNVSGRHLPSKDELRIWRDYIEMSDLLRRLMSSRMQSASGLSSGDYAVMLALSEADERAMRSSELASHIGWDRSRLSHHLGRMEKRGLLRRERYVEDNRGALVVLTTDGLRLFRNGSVPHLRDVRELFVDALTPLQLAAVADVTTALRAHLDLEPES